MIPLSPARLLAAANALVGLDEGDESGRLGSIFLREVSAGAAPGVRTPWDTAFVHHVGWWAHYDAESGRSSWPFVPEVGCGELHRFANKHRAVTRHPQAGDLFLLWSPARGTFLRSGIVMRASDEHRHPDGGTYRDCETVEGDSDELLRGSGGSICRHTRQLGYDRGDRFVRWTALDLRVLRSRETARGAAVAVREAA